MNESSAIQNERIVDVRDISAGIRHTVIHQLFENLKAEQTLQLVVDHDPRRLKLQLEDGYGPLLAGIIWSAAPTFGGFASFEEDRHNRWCAVAMGLMGGCSPES